MPRKHHKKKRPTQKLQYVVLAALAALTLGVVGFVFLKPSDAPPATTSTPAASATQTATTTPIDSAPMLAEVKGMITGSAPLTISVLGDSTSNSTGEFVDLWAKDLTKYGTVTLHLWNEKEHAWLPTPTVYQGGARAITIWNGSQPGSNFTYALQRLDLMVPEKPSFVIHNYGHNKATKRTDAGAMDLLTAIDKKWGATPAVVILQNPAENTRKLFSAESAGLLRDWAARVGYPIVDVHAAFVAAGPLHPLMLDDVHPNPAGQRIWADTIKAALG